MIKPISVSLPGNLLYYKLQKKYACLPLPFSSLPNFYEAFTCCDSREELKKKRKELSSALAKILGEKVKAQRICYNVSSFQLATYLGISIQQLRKFEKGINSLGVVYLLLLSAFFNVSVDYYYSPVGV